jgi:hypothetical protein
MNLQKRKGLRLCALGFILLAFSVRLFDDKEVRQSSRYNFSDTDWMTQKSPLGSFPKFTVRFWELSILLLILYLGLFS